MKKGEGDLLEGEGEKKRSGGENETRRQGGEMRQGEDEEEK